MVYGKELRTNSRAATAAALEEIVMGSFKEPYWASRWPRMHQYIEQTRKDMKDMTSEERMILWGQLMEGYCTHCGDEDPQKRCQCWNDE